MTVEGKRMTMGECIQAMAQSCHNLHVYTNFWDALLEVDSMQHKGEGNRKELSRWGAIPRRHATEATSKDSKYRDPGNFLYRVTLETFQRSRQQLHGDGKLKNYDYMSGAGKTERAGDYLECVLGKYHVATGLPEVGWETWRWGLTLSKSNPQDRLIAYFCSFFIAVEDFTTAVPIPTHLQKQPAAIADKLAEFIEDDLHTIFMWSRRDAPEGERVQRSYYGAMRQQERNASRAAARRQKGIRGKGGKHGGKDSGKGSCVTAPPSAGAASTRWKPQRPFPPPWHDSDDSSEVGEQLSCMLDPSFTGDSIQLVHPSSPSPSRWADVEVDWD